LDARKNRATGSRLEHIHLLYIVDYWAYTLVAKKMEQEIQRTKLFNQMEGEI
jgi:hypothetical protein